MTGTYDDARDGDERKDEGHVRLRPAEGVVHRERVHGVSATKNRNEQEPLHISYRQTCTTRRMRRDGRTFESTHASSTFVRTFA